MWLNLENIPCSPRSLRERGLWIATGIGLAASCALTSISLARSAETAPSATTPSSTKPAKPRAIRIASWDLHDLWHEPGVALRGGMTKRRAEDFKTLSRKARALNADVVALQGIGSPRAARKLFSAREYFVVFSRELSIRQQRDRDILSNPARRRVYNAIAIRRTAKLRFLAREQILETADPSPALGAVRPQGHSALAVKLRINKRPVWVVTSRLLSGCTDSEAATSSTRSKQTSSKLSPKCTALRDQVLVLNAWKSRKAAKQEAVVMAVALPEKHGASDKSRTIPTAFQTLTKSDPVKVTIAHNARKRAEDRRRGGVRQFVLTNPIVGTPTQAAIIPVQQANTVPLTGPTRAPGQRLASAETKTPEKKGNFVVEALSDFAKAALSEKTKTSLPKTKGKAITSAKTLSLVDTSVAALARLGEANTTTKPTSGTTLENLATGTGAKTKPDTAKTYFVRFPARGTPKDCRAGHVGMNFLFVDKAFHKAVRGLRFDTALKPKSVSSVASGARTDCAVYVDIPQRKS